MWISVPRLSGLSAVCVSSSMCRPVQLGLPPDAAQWGNEKIVAALPDAHRERVLAFAMARHPRLGAQSVSALRIISSAPLLCPPSPACLHAAHRCLHSLRFVLPFRPLLNVSESTKRIRRALSHTPHNLSPPSTNQHKRKQVAQSLDEAITQLVCESHFTESIGL